MDSENRMSVRRCLIPLALALLVARCSDHIGPPPAPAALTPVPHVLRWAGGTPPSFTTVGALPGRVGREGFLSTAGLSLSQNVATFWAVRGEARSVQINYKSSTGDTSSQFLRLTTVDPAFVPGRGELALGDSVLITVTIDTNSVKVSFEPTGLLFGDPAQLQISYGGAGGDLNGDGVVDSTDAQIESQLLGLWYREGTDSAWARIAAVQSLPDKSFMSALPHFSEYEVSFSEYGVSW